MKSNMLVKMVVMSLIVAFAAIAPASANKMLQNDESIQGVVKSQTVLAGDTGQKYLIIGTNDNLGMYIGKKVKVEGLVTAKNPATSGREEIRIEHIEVVR